jgi:transposase
VEVTTIGIDVAKDVFAVHGVDGMSKLPACLVGLEACTSAHYWARELGQLRSRQSFTRRPKAARAPCGWPPTDRPDGRRDN